MVPSLSSMQAELVEAWRVLDKSVAAAALPHMRSLPAIPVVSVRYRPQRNGIRIGVALRRLLLEVCWRKRYLVSIASPRL